VKDQVVSAGKVTLRPKKLEDAWNDYTWRTDPELATLDATVPTSQSFEVFFLYYREELRAPSPWSQRYSIITSDGKHIGNCMTYDINIGLREAEVGIMIGNRDYWDQSYGYDSMTALVDHLFMSTGLRHLYLHTLAWNSRARKCFEKCGFMFRQIEEKDDKSFALMDIYRNQWLKVRNEKLLCTNRI
jgi:RimJ/RimL family protein N-acetyltransferase